MLLAAATWLRTPVVRSMPLPGVAVGDQQTGRVRARRRHRHQRPTM
jgi:hypothetical protein